MPLNRSPDQGGQSGFKLGFGCGVQRPVGSTKLELSAVTSGDMPAVSVDKPVVKPTEKNQIVQICWSAFRPVDNMVV